MLRGIKEPYSCILYKKEAPNRRVKIISLFKCMAPSLIVKIFYFFDKGHQSGLNIQKKNHQQMECEGSRERRGLLPVPQGFFF
jgi:hypothetical protein